MHYNLYCKDQWTKSLVMNISFFVSGVLTILIQILADNFGRKLMLQVGCPIGIIGSLIGLFSESLISITIANILIMTSNGVIFWMCWIYLNEILINPLRSQSNGIKSFALSVGFFGIYC